MSTGLTNYENGTGAYFINLAGLMINQPITHLLSDSSKRFIGLSNAMIRSRVVPKLDLLGVGGKEIFALKISACGTRLRNCGRLIPVWHESCWNIRRASSELNQRPKK